MSSPEAASVILEPNIDAYGSKARASALADFLEVAALARKRITRAALADIISDNEWVKRPRRQTYLQELLEDPETWVEAVFNVVAERSEQLGEAYPFVERGRALTLRESDFDVTSSGYVALLALTVVHAWSIPCVVDPKPTLEAIVESVLKAKGMDAVNVGATDRRSGFVQAVRDAGCALGLQPMDDPSPRSRWAKDAGVDTLAGLVWRDRRPAGQWLFIGQVTVAQSQNWQVKLDEPQGPRWAKYMQEVLPPQAFLAIPHHAEEEHLHDLLASQRGLVVDRLRLVMNKPPNTPDEISLIVAMASATVAA
jgi:hypothetical protein